MTPSGSHIVGTSRDADERVVRYRAVNNYVAEYSTVVPGASFQGASGVSDDGTVMSVYVEAAGTAASYLVADGEAAVLLRSVPVSQANLAHSYEVSGDGRMVIGFDWRWTSTNGLQDLSSIIRPRSIAPDSATVLGAFGGRAILLDPSGEVHDVAELLSQQFGLTFPGWQLTDIVGMSDDGTVWAGNGINPQGFPEGWVAVIPEPTSSSLMALAASAWIRRRR